MIEVKKTPRLMAGRIAIGLFLYRYLYNLNGIMHTIA